MDTIKSLVESNANNARKTKNNDLYFKIVCAICSDDSYVAKNVKNITADGAVITDDLKLSVAFKRILAQVLKKSTSMTEAEAFEAANGVELTTDQAKTLMYIIHEADYIMMKDCNKKVQMFNKPGFDITLSIGTAPESIRPNPQNRAVSVKIEAHDRLQVSQKIFDFQKKTVKTPKK